MMQTNVTAVHQHGSDDVMSVIWVFQVMFGTLLRCKRGDVLLHGPVSFVFTLATCANFSSSLLMRRCRRRRT